MKKFLNFVDMLHAPKSSVGRKRLATIRHHTTWPRRNKLVVDDDLWHGNKKWGTFCANWQHAMGLNRYVYPNIVDYIVNFDVLIPVCWEQAAFECEKAFEKVPNSIVDVIHWHEHNAR